MVWLQNYHAKKVLPARQNINAERHHVISELANMTWRDQPNPLQVNIPQLCEYFRLGSSYQTLR